MCLAEIMVHIQNLLSVTSSIISLISADTLYESYDNDEKFKTIGEMGREHFLELCYEDYKLTDEYKRKDSPLTFEEWKAETDDKDYKAFLCAYKDDLTRIEGMCEHGETFYKDDPHYTNLLHTSLGVKIADIEINGGSYSRVYLTPEQIKSRNNIRRQITNADNNYRIYNEFNLAKNPELSVALTKGSNFVPKSISINSGGGWDTSQNAPIGLHRVDVRCHGRSIEEAYEVSGPMQRFIETITGNFVRTYTVTGEPLGDTGFLKAGTQVRTERNRKILSFIRRESGPIELLDRNVDWPIVYSVYIMQMFEDPITTHDLELPPLGCYSQDEYL